MKSYLLIFSLIASIISFDASACATAETVQVKVDGLVCDFCARALEKVFGAREEVGDITVDLDKGSVLIHLKPGQSLDDATVSKLITDAGYNIANIDREC